MKPDVERNTLREKIRFAFKDTQQPEEIDSYNPHQHEKSEYILFLEKERIWHAIDIAALEKLPHLIGEGFLGRLTDGAFVYYTPLVLLAGVAGKPSSFAYNEILFEFTPPEIHDLYTPENQEKFRRRMALFSPEQMNVIADVLDYQSRVELNWPARQAFEAYWHTFATRQPEIWEPWIK